MDKPTFHAGIPHRRLVYAWEGEVAQLRAENERLRKALQQIAIDCGKVMDDEICSEAERRSWRAIGRFALHAARVDGE